MWDLLLQDAADLRTFCRVDLCLGFNRHANDRLGKRRRFEHHFKIFVAKRVAGGDVSQANQCRNIAGIHRLDILAFAALDDHEATDSLALARARIVDRFTL